jgi:hypothetical protein
MEHISLHPPPTPLGFLKREHKAKGMYVHTQSHATPTPIQPPQTREALERPNPAAVAPCSHGCLLQYPAPSGHTGTRPALGGWHGQTRYYPCLPRVAVSVVGYGGREATGCSSAVQ